MASRKVFSEKKIILGDGQVWYTSFNCLWRTAFALADFQDLSTIYEKLEPFFVRRLGVKKASPSMLISEVGRMARVRQPDSQQIHTRLVEIGMMLSRASIDDNILQALSALKEVKFLPMRSSDGTVTLVNVEERFAIADHGRYAQAFLNHGVLLDFQVEEVQLLHSVFRRLGLTDRYLSKLVKEVSIVGDDARVDDVLSQRLMAKAYALYWYVHPSEGALTSK